MKILLLVLSLFSEVLCFDFKSFGCECGHHKNGKDGNLGCHPDQKNKVGFQGLLLKCIFYCII